MTPTASSPTSRKSAARLAAVQALYEVDVTQVAAKDVVGQFLANRWQGRAEAEVRAEAGGDATPLAEADTSFFREVVEGVMGSLSDVDPMIEGSLNKGWTVARLEILLRAILRAGAFELLSRPEIPARAVISEYVDVAHAFFEGNEPGLVNGVLDKLARRLREGEF